MSSGMAGMTKVLNNLREKYKHYDNIYNLTKQMEEVMSINDQVAFGVLLEMRERVMDIVDEIDEKNREIIIGLPLSMQEKLQNILYPKQGETLQLDNPLETNLFDTNKRNIVLLNRAISLDKRVNNMVTKKPTRTMRG